MLEKGGGRRIDEERGRGSRDERKGEVNWGGLGEGRRIREGRVTRGEKIWGGEGKGR